MEKAKESTNLLQWAVLVVALLMLGAMLIPAEVWNHPTNDAIYEGFDPNLIYIGQRDNISPTGMVESSEKSLKITPFPNSETKIHLLSSNRDFQAEMDVVILDAPPESRPLRIAVWRPELWQPTMESGVFWDFSSSPDNVVTMTALTSRTVSGSGTDTEQLKNETVGRFQLGVPYRVKISTDTHAGVINATISSPEGPPTKHNMLKLEGSDEIGTSEPVQVKGGETYTFGGTASLVAGQGDYVIGIYWWDENGQRLSVNNYWRPVDEINGWTKKELNATAPPEAVRAAVYLSASRNTIVLFSDVFLHGNAEPNLNLLPNGDFSAGAASWRSYPNLPGSLVVLRPSEVEWNSSVTAKEDPLLFSTVYETRPIDLTLFVSSSESLANVVVTNYKLTLPHWTGWGIKTQDDRVTTLLVTLTALGLVFCVAKTVRSLRRSFHIRIWIKLLWSKIIKLFTPQTGSFPLIAGAVAVLYLALNLLLFRLSGTNNNLTSDSINAYIASKYGLGELYFLANVQGRQALVWGGNPLFSSYFVNGPVLAYIFAGVGWIYRLLLMPPAGQIDLFVIGLLVKSVNVLFGLVDAGLIYLILRNLRVSRRSAGIVTLLFLFNPALWLLTSIWGTTHTVSLCFLLAAMWMGQKKAPVWSWLLLLLSCLTRVQLLVPALFLGLIFLRVFSLKQNLRAVSRSVVVAFLLVTPIMFATSISLPLDNVLYVSRIQNFPDPAVASAQPVSGWSYNIWPLIAKLTNGLSGPSRFLVSQNTPLMGSLTYLDLSNILFFGSVLVMACLILLRRDGRTLGKDYLLLLCLGFFAALIFKTGTESAHFILVLPLLILLRKSLNKHAFYVLVSVFSIFLLVATFSQFASVISPIPDLEPLLNYDNNLVTRFFVDLSMTDWFITLGSLASMATFVWLFAETVRSVKVSLSAPRRVHCSDV